MTEKTNQLSPMLEEIFQTPKIMRYLFDGLNKQTRLALSHEDILQVLRIVITGCGDSYYAGLATRHAFESYAGVPTTALPSMEASRYLFVSKNLEFTKTLVAGVSVSGEISRTVEAMKRANQRDALTCAITGKVDSRVASEAKRVIQVPTLPKVDGNVHVPGTRSFTASMMALYLLAYHFAEVRDRLPVEDVNKLGLDLLGLADDVEIVIQRINEPVKLLAEKWKRAEKFIFLGSGPNYATALFSAAKIAEATGRFAVGLDIEEYAHLYHFCSDAGIPIILYSPNGNATSRTVELINLMRRQNRELIVVTTKDVPFSNNNDAIYVMNKMDESTSPLILSVFGNLLGAHLRDTLKVPYFNSLPPDPSPQGNTIVSSHVEGLEVV